MTTATQLIKFSVTDQAIAELKQKFTGLVVSFGDVKGYKALAAAISEIRGKRTEVEATRKELNEDALKHQRNVNAEAKRIIAALEEIEQPLKGMKEAYDTEVERVKAEKLALEAARIAEIHAKIASIANLPIKFTGKDSSAIREALVALQHHLIDESFQELAGQADLAKSEAVATLQQMLTDREAFEAAEVERKAREAAEIEARRAEAERLVAEAELLRKEREAFAEQQRIANEQANVARLAEQALRAKQEAEAQQKRDAEQAELRKQQAELAAQKAEQEAELARQQAVINADRERLERAEAERVQAENMRQAELARKEQERLDAEQAERDEAERVARVEALRPDLEKLKAHADEFLKGLPIMSTEDGFAMRDCLRIAVESIIEKWDV
jgi:hypothetical protein